MERMLFDSSLRALALAIIAGLAIIFLRRHVAARHLLWTAVLAGMFTMPLLRLALPRAHVPATTRVSKSVNEMRASLAEVAPPLAPPPAPSQTVVVTDRPPVQFPYEWIYLTIVAILLARIALGLFLANRTLRTARPIGEELWMHDDLIAAARVRVSIEESDRVKVPVTCGFHPARIILPANWRAWSTATVRMVLAHELTHASRRDLGVTLLASVNQAVFWFHPLAWWLKRHLAVLAEHVADERGAAEAVDSASYARVLLNMAGELGGRRQRILWGGAAIAEQFVARRVRRVLSDRGKRSSSALRGMACAAGVALVLLAAMLDFPAAVRGQTANQERALFIGHLADNLDQVKTTAAEAAQLEQRLATDPEAEEIRQQLISYYYKNGPESKRVELVLWLIDRHPDSTLHGHMTASIQARGPKGDPAASAEAQRRWTAAVVAHPNDPRVLLNASRPPQDLAQSLDLLERARQLDPANYGAPWESAVLLTLERSYDAGQSPSIDPALPGQLRARLLASTDAALVERMSRRIVEYAAGAVLSPRSRTDVIGLKAVATDLIGHGRTLAPANGIWDDLAEGVRNLSQPTYNNQSAPATIRIGAGAAAANLLKSAPPAPADAHIGGAVKLQIRIGNDGHVMDATLVSGPPQLVQAAIDRVRTYEYRPFTVAGKGAEALTTVDVVFP